MKKIFLLSLSLFLLISHSSAITVISGTWNRKASKISLFEVQNGKLKEIGTSTLSPNNEFGFAFNQAKAGFYVVGMSARSAVDNYTFYLKPNDKLNVTVDNTSYTLSGDNTPENMEMQRWHDLILPLELKSIYFMKNNSSYVDFFPLLDEKLEQTEAYKSTYTADAAFNKAFDEYRRFDVLTIVLNFLYTPRSAHPQGDDLPDFINSISLSDITATPAVLDYPYGLNLIRQARMRAISESMGKMSEAERKKASDSFVSMERDLPALIDPIVRGEVILETAQNIQSFDGLSMFEKQFGQYLINESQQKRMKELVLAKAETADGQVAFDFKFKDVNDKDVALSDFKGKVVYIDVWATWCGPCKKEIPSLKKLESEYKNKNIIFLGVSIDSSKDYQKWKEFLVKEELAGVQIFAGDKKDEIGKPYNIKGIPRFILIGKDGKIISADAPRPSSTEIRVLLDASLKK